MAMIRIGAIIILAASLCVASAAEAHISMKCRKLLIAAAKETRIVVRNNKRVQAAINRLGWIKAKRYDYERLMDVTAQLLGALTSQFVAMERAINCVAKN